MTETIPEIPKPTLHHIILGTNPQTPVRFPRFIDERGACCRPVAVGVRGRTGGRNASHHFVFSTERLEQTAVRRPLGSALGWSAGASVRQLAPLALGCAAGS